MHLGAFSIRLRVKELGASKAFCEKLGFSVLGGDEASKYLIMKNGNALIGLFQGMFEGNILPFHPGWDEEAQPPAAFEDVRSIQRRLKAEGIKPEQEAEENAGAPDSLVVVDPDGIGIAVRIDQHL